MLVIEYDKLYKLTINSEYQELPLDIISKISTIVALEFIANALRGDSQMKLTPFPIRTFLNDIDWKWMSNRGSLPKRIKKWYYDTLSAQLSDTALTAIGNCVRKEIIKNQTYYLDFTKSFTWEAGEYGDNGSCFFSDRSDIRAAMQKDPRFIAIRFYTRHNIPKLHQGSAKYLSCWRHVYAEDDCYYTGISRAWVCKETVKFEREDHTKDKEFFVVFNGYGHTTKTIASIFSHFSGYEMKSIGISNEGKAAGGLYLNEGGYLLSTSDILKDINSYDFGVVRNVERGVLDAMDRVIMGRDLVRLKHPIKDPIVKGANKAVIEPEDTSLNIMLLAQYPPDSNGYAPPWEDHTRLEGSCYGSAVSTYQFNRRAMDSAKTDEYEPYIKFIKDKYHQFTLDAYKRPEQDGVKIETTTASRGGPRRRPGLDNPIIIDDPQEEDAPVDLGMVQEFWNVGYNM